MLNKYILEKGVINLIEKYKYLTIQETLKIVCDESILHTKKNYIPIKTKNYVLEIMKFIN
jgi:hypothetical protein